MFWCHDIPDSTRGEIYFPGNVCWPSYDRSPYSPKLRDDRISIQQVDRVLSKIDRIWRNWYIVCFGGTILYAIASCATMLLIEQLFGWLFIIESILFFPCLLFSRKKFKKQNEEVILQINAVRNQDFRWELDHTYFPSRPVMLNLPYSVPTGLLLKSRVQPLTKFQHKQFPE